MDKVITRILGGLGNQMFSYAAARALALRTNSELILDTISYFEQDFLYRRKYQLQHFRIPCREVSPRERRMFESRYLRYINRHLNRMIPFQMRWYIFQEKIEFDEWMLKFRPHGTVYLEGYWQSENYFKDEETQIRKDFSLDTPAELHNLQLGHQMRTSESVALHFRFFDRPGSDEASNISAYYYESAISIMDSYVPHAHYFIFSDNPDEAKKRIRLPEQRMTVISHNIGDDHAWKDMWLMRLCKHFIIANSTFSWWGAWLSQNPDKIVIAPKAEIRAGVSSWGFNGLLPNEWIKL